jgi:hypothetical protein
MNIMIMCWTRRGWSTHALLQQHKGMNFQESRPKDDLHISFKEKKMPKKFGEQHQGSKRIGPKQNWVCAHKLLTNPCMCKRSGFMESSNAHNFHSYNTFFGKFWPHTHNWSFNPWSLFISCFIHFSNGVNED